MTREEYFQLATLLTKAIRTGAFEGLTATDTFQWVLGQGPTAPQVAEALTGWVSCECPWEYDEWLAEQGIEGYE